MTRCAAFMLLVLLLGGCAGQPVKPSASAAYAGWPETFQADYVWEGSMEGFSLAMQPKTVRILAMPGQAVRMVAFNFLGATVWDVRVRRTPSGKQEIRLGKPLNRKLAEWMAHMAGQVFLDMPAWRGWDWTVHDRSGQLGVLSRLTFEKQGQRRELNLLKAKPGPLPESAFGFEKDTECEK